MSIELSVVIPVYNEGHLLVAPLERILDTVTIPCEVLVIYDSPDDTSIEHLKKLAEDDPRLVPTLNTYGPGPARAMRFGFDHAEADVVVVTMADGSDDPSLIEPLTRLVQRGVVVAAASRYTHGGQQIGGPALKSTLSRLAGISLFWLARVGTHDATNSFKAYDRAFVQRVGIEADGGFEMGIELVAKARRHRLPVGELPTIWLDTGIGTSNFQLQAWIGRYLHWYLHSFGPRVR